MTDCEILPAGIDVSEVGLKVSVTGVKGQTVTRKAWPLSQIGTIDGVREACLSWPTRKRDMWSEKTALLTQINTSFVGMSLYLGLVAWGESLLRVHKHPR